jgi:hypothetical protein
MTMPITFASRRRCSVRSSCSLAHDDDDTVAALCERRRVHRVEHRGEIEHDVGVLRAEVVEHGADLLGAGEAGRVRLGLAGGEHLDGRAGEGVQRAGKVDFTRQQFAQARFAGESVFTRDRLRVEVGIDERYRLAEVVRERARQCDRDGRLAVAVVRARHADRDGTLRLILGGTGGIEAGDDLDLADGLLHLEAGPFVDGDVAHVSDGGGHFEVSTRVLADIEAATWRA